MHDLIDAMILGAAGPTTLATQPAATAVALAAGARAVVPRAVVPRIVARVGVRVRAGLPSDVAFIDRLQKAHSRELGFLPTMAIEGKIKLGQVLIAVAATPASPHDGDAMMQGDAGVAATEDPIGYLIAADRYCRRDELGCITQINVVPDYRRSLVAAELLQAQFDRSAYGCRLYCCWCAQDLKANAFWEAMGFTAIAFRTGSRTKGRDANGKAVPRIHLFWQKRVRAGDTGDATRDGPGGGTPWWYPAQTGGGELREDRLVFPIPPGTHWRDVLPVVLPETANAAVAALPAAAQSGAAVKVVRVRKAAADTKPSGGIGGALWFGGAGRMADTDEDRAAMADAKAEARAAAKAVAKAAARAAILIDPRLTAMARELRDRWSETAAYLLSMPGKYDLRRAIDAPIARQAVTFEPSATPRLALPLAA